MKRIYRHIFLKGLLTGTGILLWAVLSVSGQERYSFNRKVVNWGVKAGLNANAMMHLQVTQGEEELTDVSFRNKTGCDIIGFFRLNLDRFFIQPEFGWTVLNKDILFSLPENDRLLPVELSFRTQTANANGLIGYNITKTGPFVFNVLAGTSLRYRFSTRMETGNTIYSNSHPANSYQYNNPMYNAYALVGFSMNISNIHFNIRYAVSMFAPDIYFDELPDKPDRLEGIVIRKNENILSFSCGVMF
ncbi:MAG: hypothetical protein LBH19_00750 [Dysgonamonadaceae bacterium]|jgi:hypothetical protein|nr:hypothetical protein [Dysgonamonadaceae bacterium]